MIRPNGSLEYGAVGPHLLPDNEVTAGLSEAESAGSHSSFLTLTAVRRERAVKQ